MSKEKKEKKPKSKARKIVEWVLTGIFAAAFVAMGAAQIDGLVHRKDHYGVMIRFGTGNFIVQTDSMVPVYPVKSAIVTVAKKPAELYEMFMKGETIDITFMDCYTTYNEWTTPTNEKIPEGMSPLTDRTMITRVPMTHRVREIHLNESVAEGKGRYTFIVAGINISSHQSGAGQYQAFTEKEVLGQVVYGSRFLGYILWAVSSPFGLLILLLIPAGYLVISSVLSIFSAMKEPDEAKEGASEGSGSIEGMSKKDKERLKQQLLEEMLEKKRQEKAKQLEETKQEGEHEDEN